MEPEVDAKRSPGRSKTLVVGARMPRWSKKPPLDLLTLCSPSVTLMPFEYCLPFDDVEKLKDVKDWQDFVKETCGVSLTVYTACLPGAAVSKS